MKLRLARFLRRIANRFDPPPQPLKFPTVPPGADWRIQLGFERAEYASRLVASIAGQLPPNAIEVQAVIRYDDGDQVKLELTK